MVTVELVVTAIVVGLVYSFYGFITKAEKGEPLVPKRMIRTTVLTVAGAVAIAFEPTETFSQAAIEQQGTAIAVVGIVFDHAWAKLQNEGYVPEALSDEIAIPGFTEDTS